MNCGTATRGDFNSQRDILGLPPRGPGGVPRWDALRYGRAGPPFVAEEYTAAGFTAVVQDNIYGPHIDTWLDHVTPRPVHLVVLRPTVAVLEQRYEDRRRTLGKIAYRGDYTAARNDRDLATTRRDLGLWLDTSSQTAAETVCEILARAAEAIVEA